MPRQLFLGCSVNPIREMNRVKNNIFVSLSVYCKAAQMAVLAVLRKQHQVGKQQQQLPHCSLC